jgi:hypothetical protein
MELTLYLQVLQDTVRGHGPCGANATDNSSTRNEPTYKGKRRPHESERMRHTGMPSGIANDLQNNQLKTGDRRKLLLALPLLT